jgi:hypothetical protein
MSPFLQANSHSANQEIPRKLWNTKVHYRATVAYLQPDEFSPHHPTLFPQDQF